MVSFRVLGSSALMLAVFTALCQSVEGQIQILPAEVRMTGPDASQRLLVEYVEGGTFRGPVTDDVHWSTSDESVADVRDGIIIPRRNGEAILTAVVNQQTSTCRVEVIGFDTPLDWEFRRHVLPLISKAGCNSGACHGALAGKGGFKLSLRGYDPGGDHFAITRQARGRRIELSDPGRSLLLAKPTTAIPHKGGLRIDVGSKDYRVLADWITQGATAPSANDPTLERLEVLPQVTALEVGQEQPLLIRATYSDDRQEDVSQWARFTSTNESVAKVNDEGVITVVGHGEGAVVAWFSSQIVLSRIVVPYPNQIDARELASSPRRNFIDDLVLSQLQRLRLRPSPRSTDAEFLRRVYLDVIGTLPTQDEVIAFLDDTSPDKRDRLIDQLLARSEYVDYWTYKWSDMLLVNGRRLRPLAMKAYYQWIRAHVADNTPWDEFVRGIITATGETEANGATNFFSLHQSPEDMTENVCQAFLSLSIGCAKCHNHPLEKWTNDQYYAMASHFARVRAKGWGGDGRNGDGLRTLFLSNEGELVQPRTGKPQPPTPLDGDPLSFTDEGDRREHLAAWLTDPENPYFARAIANRIWANFFGIGIVNPVDDLRASNPATNEPLLSALADCLVERDFDLKSLMKTILQSETYQRTSNSLPENKDDQLYFSRCFPRRLTAEVLLDAIAQVSEVPTEFTQIGFDGADFQDTQDYPLGTRSIQLFDSAVVSNFLKTFGRNERDITCECERSNTPSIVQVLHINNGVTINDRLSSEQSCVAKAIDRDVENAAAMVREAYLKALSRTPTAPESASLTAMLTAVPATDRRELLEDLYWSLLSSREFLFNH
jgi:hypothetical protein